MFIYYHTSYFPTFHRFWWNVSCYIISALRYKTSYYLNGMVIGHALGVEDKWTISMITAQNKYCSQLYCVNLSILLEQTSYPLFFYYYEDTIKVPIFSDVWKINGLCYDNLVLSPLMIILGLEYCYRADHVTICSIYARPFSTWPKSIAPTVV